mgnify:FL=1
MSRIAELAEKKNIFLTNAKKMRAQEKAAREAAEAAEVAAEGITLLIAKEGNPNGFSAEVGKESTELEEVPSGGK